MPNQDLELRSEEVQEILTQVPGWMIRWGNLVILILVLIFFGISWVIKYPDIVTSEIVITTVTPPEKLIARSSGKFEKILVADHQLIQKGTPLAIIENTANYNDVFKLKTITDTLNVTPFKLNFPFEKFRNVGLGEISTAYAVFQNDYEAYKLNSSLQPYLVEKNAQNFEFLQLQQRLSLLFEQKEIAEKEIIVKKRELERFKKLHDKGVIATQEWDIKNLEYLQYEKGLRNLISSISETRSSLNDVKKNSETTNINETKDEVTLLRNAVQSFILLKKAVADWEMKFVLRSTISGEVSFLQIWKENQSVTAEDHVFTVIPKNNLSYIGKVKAIAQNSGKIKEGQKVNIRLSNYPDREFGILTGEVRNISLTPDKDGKLLIDVVLPKGLNTSYNKSISFQQEMSGIAEIVTEDLRLIERLLYQFRDIFNRKNEIKSADTEKNVAYVDTKYTLTFS